MSLPRFLVPLPTTLVALVLCLSGVATLHGQPALPHPLDPLTADEITTAIEILQSSDLLGADVRYPLVFRQEPDKSIVRGHSPGDEFSRIAVCVLLHRKTGHTSEAKIDLRNRQLVSHTVREGTQPPVIIEEFLRAEEIVRQDKRWQEAMRKRGLTDEQFPEISVDAWTAGFVPGREGQRLMRAISYLRGKTDNHIPRVIEGVIALVDITSESVIELTDSGIVPVPPDSLDVFNPQQNVARRPMLKPLRTELPDGANFSLDGHEVRWENWSLRHSWHPREGLVLHQIAYHDGTDSRSILYRASLSEMLVPYADPSEAWQWRSPFDVGEYRLGSQLIAVRPGFEIPEHATVMPAVMCGDDGEIRSIVNAWGIYEQDGGIQWLHVATHHQHFFNFRLDFDVDGVQNSVYEMELEPEILQPDHFSQNAFLLKQRLLRSENEAQRDVDFRSHRSWKVIAPNRWTTLGHFPAYEIVPGTNAIPLSQANSPARQRGGFVNHHLWVTRFHPDELYAAGEYPTLSSRDDGLPRYATDDEPLDNTDVVVWYTMGVNHVARAEE